MSNVNYKAIHKFQAYFANHFTTAFHKINREKHSSNLLCNWFIIRFETLVRSVDFDIKTYKHIQFNMQNFLVK